MENIRLVLWARDQVTERGLLDGVKGRARGVRVTVPGLAIVARRAAAASAYPGLGWVVHRALQAGERRG